MKWYSHLKIRAKLLFGFMSVALIAAIIGVVGVSNMASINRMGDELYQDNVVPLSPLNLVAVDFQRIRVNLRDEILDNKNQQRYETAIRQLETAINQSLALYDKNVSSQKERTIFSDLKADIQKYIQNQENVMALARLNRDQEAFQAMVAFKQVALDGDNHIIQLFKLNTNLANQRNQMNTATARTSSLWMIAILAIGALLSIGLGFIISGSISKPIARLSQQAEKLAVGNTDVNIDAQFATKDEIGELTSSFAKFVSNFVAPINEAIGVLNKMAVNDYTATMSGDYQGVVKELAEQINTVRKRLLSVQDIAQRVSKGDTGRLEEFTQVGKRSDNDQMVPAFRAMMQTIQDLIHETGRLAAAAVKGDLAGGYREVISGMNQTMDAVAGPIRDAAEVLREMAHGNLTVAMTGMYQGDYAVIKESVNETIDSFNHILNDINNAAAQVASGSKQLSDASIALSQGATEQASTIEELTASLEEIASQTKLNAGHANEANSIADTVKTNADQGNRQMTEMLQAMEEINKASGSISRIIKVIDEIAFQTNILALNAAVEAARAGQYGKGFAVVAEEVRNLAARSADAAKETTEMIEGSIRKVEDGTRIANQTAGALAKIVEGVAKVAGLVGDISIASNEQATGIAQINQGVIQVSQVVQTNTASSEELAGQAEMLKQQIAGFKLKRSGRSFNPDEFKMIDNETDNRKKKTVPDYPVEAPVSSFKKIALTASEFGKY